MADKTKISVGDAVIINESDRPCTSMVAIITSIDEKGNVLARYLNARNACKSNGEPRFIYDSGHLEATALVDFGLVLTIMPEEEGFFFKCEQGLGLLVTAHYSQDGEQRDWQELGSDCDEFGWCEANEDVAQLWKGHV